MNSNMLVFNRNINKHSIKILIDFDSSENFIRKKFVEKSKILMYKKQNSY